MTDSKDDSYLVLRFALQRFGKAPRNLSPEQHRVVRAEAAAEARLQQGILRSDQAGAVSIPDAVLEGAVGAIRKRYRTEAEFRDDLHRNGLNEEGLGEALRRELQMEAILDTVGREIEGVSEARCRAYYREHRPALTKPERRTARHILITVQPEFPENTSERAYTRLKSLQREARAAPSRFGELAARHSECVSALDHGRLGPLPRGRLYPDLERVLFALPQGAVSEVLESPMGYHLLLCEAIHPPRVPAFEEVAPAIRRVLAGRARRQRLREWLDALGPLHAPSGH